MAANFNNSAWFYDALSKMVFGRALINAQVYLLQFIPSNSRIIVIGGGTGWILEEIAKIRSSGLIITYVEASENMMARSVKRFTGNNKVTFVNNRIENLSKPGLSDVVITHPAPPLGGWGANEPGVYDIAITPFLLDNFTEQNFQKIFKCIHALLAPNGLWLNADFQLTERWWQKVLLSSMHLFFKLLCNNEASKLPAIEKQFEKYNYKIISEKVFFGDFVKAAVYTKASTLG